MLTRERNAMPDDVRTELEGSGTMKDFELRPPYQRNDYLGWISRAKTQSTREHRITQMLDELRRGGVYMRMAHAPSRRSD